MSQKFNEVMLNEHSMRSWRDILSLTVNLLNVSKAVEQKTTEHAFLAPDSQAI